MFFTEEEKKKKTVLEIHMNPTKELSGQSNLEQEQIWKHYISWFQNIRQNYKNQ